MDYYIKTILIKLYFKSQNNEDFNKRFNEGELVALLLLSYGYLVTVNVL